MIGGPYNPNDCIFIASQALNANQFNPNVPDSGNLTTHNLLWDTANKSLIWVDTKTNLIVFEIVSGGSLPFGNDTGSINVYQTSIPGATLSDGYIFELKIKAGNTNTGPSTLQINTLGTLPVVDSDQNPIIAGMLTGGSIYLFAYSSSINSYQLLGEAKSSAGGDTFVNAASMPQTIGGYPAGTTFPTPQTMQQMWDGLLYPYQNPAFTSITNALFTSYEVGQNLPSGILSIGYTVSNATNIKSPQPPFVGVPSTNIPGATPVVNPFQLLAAGSFGINVPVNTTSNVPATFNVFCQGTNSNNQTFSGFNSLGFFFRNYWGFNANPALIAADILNLQSSQLKSGFAGTYIMPSNATTRYLYFVYPNSFGYPTTIFDNTNGFNATADFQDNGTIVAPNQYGVSVTWRMIRSKNATAGAGGFSYTLS
jgi:hypothetical protein